MVLKIYRNLEYGFSLFVISIPGLAAPVLSSSPPPLSAVVFLSTSRVLPSSGVVVAPLVVAHGIALQQR